ncbi:hypothetical protein BOX15_Mlig024454g1, partial [Macrostomum lignano]
HSADHTEMYNCIRVSQFGPSSVLQMASADVSSLSPGPGQVLIKALAAGVNPVETYIRSGQYATLPKLPYTPGSDCAGEVVAVGKDVPKRLKTGERVYTMGTVSGSYAQLVLASQSNTFRLPDNVSWLEGACLGVPAFTALRALRTCGGARAGQTVLIHGASGAVGLLCCQLAANLGMRVLATAGSPEGRQLALDCGANMAFDHHDPDYADAIAVETADTDGVHLTVEMLANVNLATDCRLASPSGRIVIVGNRGSLNFNPRLTMSNEVSVTGVFLRRSTDVELAEYAKLISEMLKAGQLRPTVDRQFHLAEAGAAHDFVINRSASLGRVVLKIDEWVGQID